MITTRKFNNETKYYIVYQDNYTNIQYGTATDSISTGMQHIELFDTEQQLVNRLTQLNITIETEEI